MALLPLMLALNYLWWSEPKRTELTGKGTVELAGSASTLDGTSKTFINDADVVVNGNNSNVNGNVSQLVSSLTLEGTIDNVGTITLSGNFFYYHPTTVWLELRGAADRN